MTMHMHLRRFCLVLSIVVVLACGICNTSSAAERASTKTVYDVRDHGAVGDGKTLDTRAIQAAIDTCHKAGGGRVYLGGGTFLSGSIFLKSNVTLYIDAGATLLGSPNVDDYVAHKPAFRSYTERYSLKSLIYAEKARNIAIMGRGTIDGNGAKFLGKPKYRIKPFVCRFVECRHVMTKDVTLRNSPFWMHHHLACDDVVVDGITVHNWVNNCNNCLTMDCCHNVRVSNCEFSSADDCFELKSTAPRACKNIAVSNCVFNGSSCNGFKLGTESIGGFQNITIGNCTFQDVRLAGVAIELVDGGTCDRVNVSDIVMKNVGAAVFVRLGNRARKYIEGAEQPGVGIMRNVTISNLQATGVGRWTYDPHGRPWSYKKPIDPKTGLSISGLPGHGIENVTLANIRLHFAGGGSLADVGRSIPEQEAKYPETDMFGVLPAYGFYVRHAKNVKFENLDLDFDKSDQRPALVFDDVEDVAVSGLHAQCVATSHSQIWLKQVRGALIHGCRVPAPLTTFVQVDGDRSGDIAVMGNDLSLARQAVARGQDVKDKAVVEQNNSPSSPQAIRRAQARRKKALIAANPSPAGSRYRVVSSRIILKHPGGMPALCRAANGDLLLAYATNWQPIPPAGGCVKLMRSSDDGKTWTAPRIIVPPKDPKKWSVHMWSGLHRMRDGSLILYYGQNRSEEVTEAYVIRSTDHGKTWSRPVRLADEKVTWDGKTLRVPFAEGFGRGVFAPNGDFLAPIGARREGGFGGTKASAFVRSSDGGKTWGPLEFIATGNMKFSETTLGRAADGGLIAIIRCDTRRRQLWQSVSRDNGRTWSAPVLGVAKNDKRGYLHGKMPDLLTLPGGRLLLAVGSVGVNDGGQVWQAQPGSSFCGLYVSDDGGKTWRPDVMFPSPDPPNLVPYDSPVLLAGKDGEILALSVQVDRRLKDDPRSGWTMGSHYVLHVIREVK